jgi:tetratricopeptide (TPR) repeat protein
MKSLRRLLPLLVACGACGGGGAASDGNTTPTGGGGGGGGQKPAQAGDVSIEVPAFGIKGQVFEPQALGRPGIPTSPPKNKNVKVAQQRALVDKTKDPVLKQAYAAQLASLIYMDAKGKPDEAKQMEDARKVLTDTYGVVGDKNADETLLLFLASYEMYFENWAGADKAWGALVAKDPKNKDLPYFKTWWAYSLLKQFKNAEAAAALQGETPSEKAPELAYVIAWTKWRNNDDAGAWQAMLAAAKGWQGNRQAIDDELYLMAARTNTPPEQAWKEMFTVFGAKQPGPQYEIMAKLGLRALSNAGRWADAVSTLDKALTLVGKAVPPNDVPVLRYSQADFTVRLDDPVRSAAYAKQAIDALPGCGAKCTAQQQQDLIGAVGGIARVFHFIYATSNDVRYFQPANDLYLLIIPLIMDPTARAERNSDADKLQRTMKGMKAGTGTHDKDAIKVIAERHNTEIQACYENGLLANPKLSGNLVVNLESDQTGVIKGVSTEPKGGAADMAMVAQCAHDEAKTWKLSTRGMPGTTRIKLTYQLTPKTAKP